MFCPHCGAALADGLQRCNCCGGTLKILYPEYLKTPNAQSGYQQGQSSQPGYQQGQSSQPGYQQGQSSQPGYRQGQYRSPQPRQIVKKGEFFRTIATGSLRVQWLLITVTFLLSLALVIGGALYPMLRPLLRIPSVNRVLSVAGVEADELVDMAQIAYDRLYQEYELEKTGLTGEELEFVEKVLDSLDRLSGKFNLFDLSVLAVELKSDVSDLLRDYLGPTELKILDTVALIPVMFIGVTALSFLVPLILTLIGGLKRSMGCTIGALVTSLVPQLIFNGWIFAGLTLAVFIAQAVFCANTGKAYKNYALGIF